MEVTMPKLVPAPRIPQKRSKRNENGDDEPGVCRGQSPKNTAKPTRVLLGTANNNLTLRSNNLCLDNLIHTQSKQPRQVSNPSQQNTAHPDPLKRAKWRHIASPRNDFVNVGNTSSSIDADIWVRVGRVGFEDPDGVHGLGEVQDDLAENGLARCRVSSGANRDSETEFVGDANRARKL